MSADRPRRRMPSSGEPSLAATSLSVQVHKLSLLSSIETDRRAAFVFDEFSIVSAAKERESNLQARCKKERSNHKTHTSGLLGVPNINHSCFRKHWFLNFEFAAENMVRSE